MYWQEKNFRGGHPSKYWLDSMLLKGKKASVSRDQRIDQSATSYWVCKFKTTVCGATFFDDITRKIGTLDFM